MESPFSLVILLFVIFITLFIIILKINIYKNLVQGMHLFTKINKCNEEYSFFVLSKIDDEKEQIYLYLSNSSLIPLPVDYYPFSVQIDEFICDKGDVKIKYNQTIYSSYVYYPAKELLDAEQKFNPSEVQQCIKNCNPSNYYIVLNNCLPTIDGFKVSYLRIPYMIDNIIYAELVLKRDDITSVYPFYMSGNIFTFVCE